MRQPNQNDDESFASPQLSSGHLAPDDETHPSPAENSPNLTTARTVLALSILVVGLDWTRRLGWYLPGVAHDINWLKWICSRLSPAVTLSTLTDGSHTIIRSRILRMFQNACPGTAIILFFNGHGDGKFMIYDETHIDAATLIEWITAIRQETRKHLSVCIVFDHCRFDSPTPPSFDLGQDIHIIWACMPGERSRDFKMDQDPRIPFSNFLKSFALVVDEAQTRSAGFADDLMSRLNTWMGAVVRATRTEECKLNKCDTLCPLCSCPNYESCTHANTRLRHQDKRAYPRVQNTNGMFWGFSVC